LQKAPKLMDSTIDHDTQAALNGLEARIVVLEEKAGITADVQDAEVVDETETTQE
jgi:hypothetical protein